MHVPAACAADESAYVEVRALGDFDGPPPATGLVAGAVGAALPGVEASALALQADAVEGSQTWQAIAPVPPEGNVDLLLLPEAAPCALTVPVDPRAGAAMAPMAGGRVLVAGGSGDPTPRTFVADMNTGEVAPVGLGLLQPRTGATVTAFGDGALVAGGTGQDGAVLATAEVYRPELDGFDQQSPIQLGQPRTDAGAVVLASGETLLVGGAGADGQTLLDSMEIVDPTSRTVRTEGVTQLAVARRLPVVVRLASGEILVAGGVDETGAPVTTLEWLAADAGSATKRPRDLVAGNARAFAALDGGGALAVVAPPPAAAPDFQTVWVVDADGALEPATPIDGTLTAPVLFGGAGGAPVLWTGDRWLRWQPWAGAFGALATADDDPAAIGPTTASPDAGMALWIATDTARVTALRFDVAGEYSPLPGPLLVASAAGLAPDRLPEAGELSFDPSAGLQLAPGASAFVADATYADADVDVDAPTGEPPIVVLRDESGDELEVGGAACPGAAKAGVTSIHVARRGSSVEWTAAGGGGGTCPTGVATGARVSVGLRGAASAADSVARDLRVTRLGGA